MLLLNQVAVSGATTLNPADKHANVGLSNGNLTATVTDTVVGWPDYVRSTTKKTSGKWHVEFTCNQMGSGQWCIKEGLATAAYDVNSANGPGTDGAGNSTAYQCDGSGRLWFQNGSLFDGMSELIGDTIAFEVDIPNGLIWFNSTRGTFGWRGYNNTVGNPGTGVNGCPIPIVNMTSSGVYVIMALFAYQGGTSQVTANFGASTFLIPVSSGFLAWG